MTLTDPDPSNESARRRWGLPVSRSQIEDEVRAELEFHLEAKVDRLIESGLSPAQARAEAERRFGPLVTVEEECLDLSMQREKQRMRLELFTDLFRDLRQAVRSLRRRPGFTATAVLTVAIGLGAVTSIFSL
ncbi:MAG: permease prefix domain 1-containing protein, partial [Acidobacteriota bacterium]